MDGRRVNGLLDKIKATNKTNNLSPVNTSTETDLWTENETSGGYCGGVPPLPIPNREVKPTCADGTAMQCGRVGSRLLSAGAPRIQCPRGSFFVLLLFPSLLPVSFLPVSLLSVLCRKPYFCQLLLRAIILFSFIHKRKGIPAICILSLSHSDIDYVRFTSSWRLR